MERSARAATGATTTGPVAMSGSWSRVASEPKTAVVGSQTSSAGAALELTSGSGTSASARRTRRREQRSMAALGPRGRSPDSLSSTRRRVSCYGASARRARRPRLPGPSSDRHPDRQTRRVVRTAGAARAQRTRRRRARRGIGLADPRRGALGGLGHGCGEAEGQGRRGADVERGGARLGGVERELRPGEGTRGDLEGPRRERGRDEERVGGVEEAVVGVALAGGVAGVADRGGHRARTVRGEGEHAGGQRRFARPGSGPSPSGRWGCWGTRRRARPRARPGRDSETGSCRDGAKKPRVALCSVTSAELVKPSEGLDSASVAGPAAEPVRLVWVGSR